MTELRRPLRHLFRWENDVKAMSFDAVLQDDYMRSAQVSRFPLETGSTISDHHQINPVELRFELHVSDTPVNIADNFVSPGVRGVYGSENSNYKEYLANNPPPRFPRFALPSGRVITNNISGSAGERSFGKKRPETSASVLIFEGGSPNRVVNVFDQLNTFIEDAVLLTVESRLRRWENMVITLLEAPTNSQSGSGIRYSIEMQQIDFVESTAITGGTRIPKNKGDRTKKDGDGEPEKATETERTDIITQMNRLLKNLVETAEAAKEGSIPFSTPAGG